ncbi:hypothetical protein HID58_040869 [Brassica napus]|uniref:Uncharacterized protein n=1 Tax=Brassica napus TaxID=3708 RepID=A0ABQ8B992_BRANA|nr:hypothetical protein HID58_040869 [Brassica napus]
MGAARSVFSLSLIPSSTHGINRNHLNLFS